MTGPSMKGSAKPLAMLVGSSTITVMRDVGALPATAFTASAKDSIRCAMTCVHSVISAGKWISNRAVVMVRQGIDRKSTRLNSSHSQISYAVFCVKKKKQQTALIRQTPG